MPELPEVETIRRDLERELPGRRIRSVQIHDPFVLTGISHAGTPRRRVQAESFIRQVRGRTVRAVSRRGKYLILEFKEGGAILFHLRMTGQLILGNPSVRGRAAFCFDGGEPLVLKFIDRRRFGEILYSQDWQSEPAIQAMGIEPLNGKLSPGFLKERFRGRSASVHSLLLNQNILAGIGNIYAAEALFRSGIRPQSAARQLSLGELAKLCDAIRFVLRDSITHRGYSMSTYLDAFGRKGETQKFTSVYAREGKPCRRCDTPLKRKVIAGRAAVYCPRCQS